MMRHISGLLLLALVSLLIHMINALEREDDLLLPPFANEIDQIYPVKFYHNLDEGPSGPGTSAANDFVDDLLKNLPRLDAYINATKLGQFQQGNLQFTNMTFLGIGDVYRDGNAHLNITKDYLRIRIRLGSPKLTLRGNYRYKLPWFLPNVTGSVHVGLNRVVIMFDLRMLPSGAEVVDLGVTRLQTITVDEVSGFAPFNGALRYLLEVIVRRNRECMFQVTNCRANI
ncbi:uncharacterized protein LOC111263105 isoform X2 [Varroa jacobsoni]|uniref:uncharacterized protein LOC111263105 isoform X2 n=1 Tax=Varroa jacobsoni TaxID=62625 RepID=UPI000BF2BAC8|nr:uncharacterized protein LOC111263105 isoform X2 [Varroa jacobsoni]